MVLPGSALWSAPGYLNKESPRDNPAGGLFKQRATIGGHIFRVDGLDVRRTAVAFGKAGA